ncbi:hypothetical protein HD842_004677 [Massilia aurea]|uniref:DUF4132 domain-containing protein n=1 Tax=Massilia aurea TaxID=373040 RepID=A0A7X0CGY1_9BURK|nr:DUF4132 domain-containing protein [Massilia aurea]MBB6136499.1 hypothetical protein [Massilia aurea]
MKYTDHPTGDGADFSLDVAPWAAYDTPLLLDDPADKTRALAMATRRHPQPVGAVDEHSNWQTVRALVGAVQSPDFDGSDPDLRADFEAAWRTLAESTPGGTPQSDAVLMALCVERHSMERNDFGVPFVDGLVARRGLLYVIEAQLAAMRYTIEEDWATKLVALVHRASATRSDDGADPMTDAQWRLRTQLAAAPQAVYDACAARVNAVIAGLAPACQIALALQFPDLPEMTHDVLERLCASDNEPVDAVHYLQLTATSDAALAQARAVDIDSYGTLWDWAGMTSTIVLEHGVDAVRWLAPGAAHDAAGDALTRIGTPEAIDALAAVAGKSKRALARLTTATGRWPAAAMTALARRISAQGGNSKQQSLLQPALVALVQRYPALPAALRPWLDPAAHAVLDAIGARLAGPVDAAAAHDLPPVLANIPWLQPRKKAAISLQLAPLPLTPVERWDDGEKAVILAPDAWTERRYQQELGSVEARAEGLGFERGKNTPEFHPSFKAACKAIEAGNATELVAAWDAMMTEKKKNPRWQRMWFGGNAAARLPAALGIPLWNAAAAEVACHGTLYVAATWGLPALPGVLARISSTPSEHLGIALHFGAVELGPVAARAFARVNSLRATGREWLGRFPEHAACALIAPALGKPSEARDCAAASLRYLAGSGHLALIESVAGRYDQPGVMQALRAMLDENPLDRYPAKRPALPAFWQPAGWRRPLLHSGKPLPDASLDALGTMMMFPITDGVYAGLHQVKAACTAQSLADFAWDCFASWLNASAPSRDNWALLSLGALGNDDTARKLTPFLRTWPSEGAAARAMTGLTVLAAIGSDVALMFLNGIAQKAKSRPLQDKARDKIADVAEARGLTPEELEDRITPDLGLDADGSLLLDFGPRAFKVGFDEALKPFVREWHDSAPGKRLPDLPKPKQTDDALLAGPAIERFKLLKKDARTIASQQVLRLELAMCTRRRWSTDVFAQCIAGHPLVRHLVRRLVWGVYAMPLEAIDEGHGGALRACFCVDENGAYVTAGDDPFTVPEGAEIRIGLPHALDLSAEQVAGFGQLLADYELLQPFPQLGRATHALTADERSANKLLRWKDVRVATGKVLGLSHIGWRRGSSEDGGIISTCGKDADGGRTLELTFAPGLFAGMLDEEPEQTLGEVTLGRAGRSGWGQDASLATFDTLDPIAASELIRDMEHLCA